MWKAENNKNLKWLGHFLNYILSPSHARGQTLKSSSWDFYFVCIASQEVLKIGLQTYLTMVFINSNTMCFFSLQSTSASSDQRSSETKGTENTMELTNMIPRPKLAYFFVTLTFWVSMNQTFLILSSDTRSSHPDIWSHFLVQIQGERRIRNGKSLQCSGRK